MNVLRTENAHVSKRKHGHLHSGTVLSGGFTEDCFYPTCDG